MLSHINEGTVVDVENGKNNEKRAVIDINDGEGIVVTIQVVSKRNGALTLKNMWKETEQQFASEYGRSSADTLGDNSPGAKPSRTTSKNSITDSAKNTSTKKSVEPTVDSQGNKLSTGQVEYFKDSKVRDENGNLLLVYHGTSHGGFSG